MGKLEINGIEINTDPIPNTKDGLEQILREEAFKKALREMRKSPMKEMNEATRKEITERRKAFESIWKSLEEKADPKGT